MVCVPGCPRSGQLRLRGPRTTVTSADSLWRRLLGGNSGPGGLLIATVIVHARSDTGDREAETEAGQKPEDDQQILGGGPQDRVAAIRHVKFLYLRFFCKL